MHGERGDEVHGEHQVVQAGAEFRAGEKDVQRIQPNIWSMSSPRTELQKAKNFLMNLLHLDKYAPNVSIFL